MSIPGRGNRMFKGSGLGRSLSYSRKGIMSVGL